MFGRRRNPTDPTDLAADDDGPTGDVPTDDATDLLDALDLADAHEAAPAAPTLTDDEVAGWRSAILHAGHGAMVPDELRLVLAAAFRSDLPALVTLARRRPDRQGEVRIGAPGGAEPGSAYALQTAPARSGVTRYDPATGREVSDAPRRITGPTSGVRVLDHATGMESDR